MTPARGAQARRIALVALAVLGGALLVFIAVSRWTVPSDDFAYWRAAERLLAGQPLYDLGLPVLATPSLTMTAFSMLIAIVPLWFTARRPATA